MTGAQAERDPFAHIDAVAAARPGDMLMVCEPVEALRSAGGLIPLPVGTRMRVRCNAGTVIYVDAVLPGRLEDVSIGRGSFAAIEVQR